MTAQPDSQEEIGYAADRFKAFADAVVAIALTLLILPLMESVGEVASAGDGAFDWLAQHRGQLLSFVLSFVLIAMFWMIHHRLFARVERVTPALMWLLSAWLLTIVWLPVATAVAGRMDDDDAVAKALYIGSLALTALMSLVVRLYLRGHPALHRVSSAELQTGVAVDVSLVLLFGVALGLALLFPVIGYFALLVMGLSGVVQRALEKAIRRNP